MLVNDANILSLSVISDFILVFSWIKFRIDMIVKEFYDWLTSIHSLKMMVPTSFIHGSRALYAFELKDSTKFAMCSYVMCIGKGL